MRFRIYGSPIPGSEAGDGLFWGGNGTLFGGDDLIRQLAGRLRDPPQGQEIPERALEPTSRISSPSRISSLPPISYGRAGSSVASMSSISLP